jgi:hypothetical protein
MKVKRIILIFPTKKRRKTIGNDRPLWVSSSL